MSRIRGVDPQEVEPSIGRILEDQHKTWGDYLKPYLVYARCPPLLSGVRGMWDALGNSGLLPRTLISLVCRRVASINGCVF